MKKIYTLGLALSLLTACSSEQESVTPNVEQSIYIDEYKDDEKIGQEVLFGEDFEQFLKMLQETMLIREPLPADRPFSKHYYHVIVQGDNDVTTMFIEEENGEQLLWLSANNIIPSGVRKATNTDILKSIEAIKASEE